MNISGVLVRSLPENIDAVTVRLEAITGVEVHGANPDGRLVVTVEDDAAGYTADTVVRFQDVEGVISTSLVYHHCEDEQDLQESAQ